MLHWGEHPWNWLTGRDTTDCCPDCGIDEHQRDRYPRGRPIIWTKDERDPELPIKPFPGYLRYLHNYIDMLFRVRRPILVDKSRQMRITWSTMLFIDHECRFVPGRRWLLSKITEDEAVEILEDKPRHVEKHLPAWVRARHHVRTTPRTRNTYMHTGSYILALTQNAADRACRGGTASGVFIDEASRQAYFRNIWQGATPMAARIIAVTTAEIGNDGARFFKELLEDREETSADRSERNVVRA